MAIDSVTANSLNSRPMMPPISRRGIRAAIREMLIDTMVKAISREPLSAAAKGSPPSSTYRVTVFQTISRSISKYAWISRLRIETMSRHGTELAEVTGCS